MAKTDKLIEKLKRFFALSSEKQNVKCEKLKKIVLKLTDERKKLLARNSKKVKKQITIINEEIKLAKKIIKDCQTMEHK